jgi:predicted RNase H-like HicB family nuclease
MLTNYIQAAMAHAEYEKLPDNTWFGHIVGLDGVWANAATREDCRVELQSALEDWILFRLTNQFLIPTIDGISLVAAKVT